MALEHVLSPEHTALHADCSDHGSVGSAAELGHSNKTEVVFSWCIPIWRDPQPLLSLASWIERHLQLWECL